MNKSKKTIKGTQKNNKKHITINPKIWVIIGSVLGVVLIAALLFDQLYKRPLVTIDGKKYYLEDLTYYFYYTESSYDYINQMYGGGYWDSPHYEATNMTVRDYAKLETLNTVIRYEVMYNEAMDKGYTLTDEEIKKIDEDINSLLNDQGLSDKIIKKNGFTEEYLKNVMTKNTLANRYEQDIIDTFDIDEEAIKAEFDYEEYRQYDIEYLNISTVVYDEEKDSNVPVSEDDKKAALDKITSFREKALNTQDWSTLIPEDEEQVRYSESNFLAKDTFFSEDFKNTVMAMDNGEISEVIETDDSYYVVRMVNNNSSERYDSVVEEAIQKKENELLTEEYNNNILPNHTVKLHNNAIRNLRMGRLTLAD